MGEDRPSGISMQTGGIRRRSKGYERADFRLRTSDFRPRGPEPFRSVFLSRSGTVGAPSLRSVQGRVRCCLYHGRYLCPAACIVITALITCALSPVRAIGDWLDEAGPVRVNESWGADFVSSAGSVVGPHRAKVSDSRPSQSTRRTGHPRCCDAGEIKSRVHDARIPPLTTNVKDGSPA